MRCILVMDYNTIENLQLRKVDNNLHTRDHIILFRDTRTRSRHGRLTFRNGAPANNGGHTYTDIATNNGTYREGALMFLH